MGTANACMTSGTSQDRGNRRRVMVWSFLYASSILVVSASQALGWLTGEASQMAMIGLSVLLGAGFIRSYQVWLRTADELRRKLEMDALAFALGAGFVGGIALEHLSDAGIFPISGTGLVTLVIVLAYAVARVVGFWRYR